MSSVYSTFPACTGRATLHTSHGDICIDLFAKEAPLAVRNFLLLATATPSPYDASPFHRVIKGFLVQTGDPTGTGSGGASASGELFKDEFHSRLRFTQRGVVAMANAGEKNTNGSQFFITLGEAAHLQKKHTIFGLVQGPTIYNLAEIGEVETDGDDKPLEPPLLKSVTIDWNPFDDLTLPSAEERAAAARKNEPKPAAARKRKGKKNLGLLSFGDEAGEDEEDFKREGTIRSSHDVLQDRKLSSQPVEVLVAPVPEVPPLLEKERETQQEDSAGSDEEDYDAKMRKNVLAANTARMKDGSIARGGEDGGEEDDGPSRVKTEPSKQISKKSKPEKKKGTLTFKKAGSGGGDVKSISTMRERSKHRNVLSKDREKTTLAKLKDFKSGLGMQRKGGGDDRKDSADIPAPDPAAEANHMALPAAWRVDGLTYMEDEECDLNWKAHKLKFVVNKRDKMAKEDNPDDYIVVDPLLEEGKEKFNNNKRRKRD